MMKKKFVQKFNGRLKRLKKKTVRVSEGVKIVRKKEKILSIDVQGTDYDVIVPVDNKILDDISADGLCDDILKKIYIRDLRDDKRYDKKSAILEMKHNIRHECIHAFVKECGLAQNNSSESTWACDEACVDFYALQYDKLGAVFTQAYQILDMLD